MIFSLASWLILYAALRSQGVHPLNPQRFASAPWDVSFNTAASFVSNTSWQFYGGETTLSYFSQMVGITVASFTSCAVGIAVAVAVSRGFGRRETRLLGNFWVDLCRSLLYVLLPLSILGGVYLVSQERAPESLRLSDIPWLDAPPADDRSRAGRVPRVDQAAVR